MCIQLYLPVYDNNTCTVYAVIAFTTSNDKLSHYAGKYILHVCLYLVLINVYYAKSAYL